MGRWGRWGSDESSGQIEWAKKKLGERGQSLMGKSLAQSQDG